MSQQSKVRILSIDGGGIRGIIPAYILNYAEKYLQKKFPNTTLADHFDFIAGTSTGGILTCIYLTPDDKQPAKAKYSAEQALNFYVKYGYEIFNASKISNIKRLWGLREATKYNPKTIESLFLQKFADVKMHDLLKPCLIPTYDLYQKSSFFFTSHDDKTNREFYLRDAARSTSAAPTYFPPAKIKNIAEEPKQKYLLNIDGGVFANNPLMCAYAEVRKSKFKQANINFPEANQMYVLSLGTGGGNFALNHLENIKGWNLLNWATAIPDVMMDGSIDTVAYQMNELFKTIQPNDSGKYLRLDVPKDCRTYDSNMANASHENISALLASAENTLNHYIAQGFNDFLDGLNIPDKKIEKL